MKKYLIYLIPILFSFYATTIYSSNYSFMADSPIIHITKEDWNIIQATANKALGTYPNNKKAAWSNPHSGNSGYLEPLDKTTEKGMTCRNLKLFYQTKYGKEVSKFNFCHYSAGWKVPPTDN